MKILIYLSQFGGLTSDHQVDNIRIAGQVDSSLPGGFSEVREP